MHNRVYFLETGHWEDRKWDGKLVLQQFL